MKYKLWQRCAIAAVAGLTAFGAASPVLAHGSNTTGSTATGYDSGDWYVTDTKCDGDSAYGRYYELGTANVQRKNNHGGCDSTADGDIGSAILSVQACRDTTWASDNCGGWNEW